MELTTRQKSFTLAGVLLALFLGALDQTIVATALPRIVEDLKGLDRYAWVATAYLLATTVMLPIYGKLADMVNRKTIELVAVALFLAGSFLCGLSGAVPLFSLLGDGMSQLIVFRALQGLGGAGLFALAFIVIADLYPPAQRGRYQGLVGSVFGLASVLGPLAGGFLTDYAGALIPGIEGWHWVFYVNLPFGALALYFIAAWMPSLRPPQEKRPLHYPSMALLVGGFLPLVLALELDKSRYPWGSPLTLGLFAASAVMLVGFVLTALRAGNPVLELRLFRNRVYATAIPALFFVGAAFISLVVFLPLFMVNVIGVSATQAGVSLIPVSLGLVLGSAITGQVVSRFGHYRLQMLIGGALLAAGMLLLSRMSADISYWRVTLYMVICGLGLGPTFPLYTLAVQNAVEPRYIGQATSTSIFFRQIGGTVGAALMGTVLATVLAGSLAGLPRLGASQTAGGDPPSPAGGMGSIDLTRIDRGIQASFDRQYALVQRVFLNQDPRALAELLANPQIPAQDKEQLKALVDGGSPQLSLQAKEQELAVIKTQLSQQAAQVATGVNRTVKDAFVRSVTRIFFYTIFIVVAGWVMTLFIPELPLRRTHEKSGAAAAG